MRQRLIALCAALAVAAAIGPAVAAASPRRAAFDWRGIVEGFYGNPYTAAQRADLLRFEAAHHMNAYVHAPKQDPYVRTLWRHPYPPGQMQELRSEIAWARAHRIAWIPDVGPGVPLIPSPNVAVPDADICFSCSADVRLLVDRYRPFVAAGATAVMVSFDDAQKVSSHPEDLAAYGSGDAAYGTMTADAVNAVAHAYPGVRVLAVPADYSGTTSTAYLESFAERLDPRVVVLWTGTAVVPATIRGQDAAAYRRIVRHQLIVWDNYPANDYAGGIVGDPTNLFMGPLTGRGPDLVGTVSGILANPMDEWSPSKLPLATVADYLDDPQHYRPEQSWRRALRQLAGADAPLVSKLAENVRSSPLGQRDAVTFAPLADEFLSAYAAGGWPAAAQRLQAELVAERDATGQLRLRRYDPEFLTDTAPFLARLTANADVALDGLDLLAAQRPALTVQTRRHGSRVVVTGYAAPPSPATVAVRLSTMQRAWQETLSDRHNVHGNRFAFDTSGTVYARRNAVDTFVHTAQGLTAQWMPQAPRAASGVAVTVNGRPVSSRFEVVVPPGSTVTIDAVDGAGNHTTRRLRV